MTQYASRNTQYEQIGPFDYAQDKLCFFNFINRGLTQINADLCYFAIPAEAGIHD